MKKLLSKLKINLPYVGQINFKSVSVWLITGLFAGVVLWGLKKIPYVNTIIAKGQGYITGYMPWKQF